MRIQIANRHGTLSAAQEAYLTEKAEKLLKYFDRLMSIEIEVDHRKNGFGVEVAVSAEHKHDFVARDEGVSPEAAMDACIHKVETQLRRYKERVQFHREDIPQGGTSPMHPDLPEPPATS